MTEQPSKLAELYEGFRTDMCDAVGHGGTYDAIAVLGHLSGRSGYVHGMGEDECFFLAQRTIALAVVCIADQQSDGTVPAEPSAGEIAADWLSQTIAEIEQAQADGYSSWAEALQARA